MPRCRGPCKEAEIKTRFLRVFNAVQSKGGKSCRPPSWNQKLQALWDAMDEEVERKRRSLERRFRRCPRGCICRWKRENPRWTRWKDVYISGKFNERRCKWKVPGAIQMKWRIRNGECKVGRSRGRIEA